MQATATAPYRIQHRNREGVSPAAIEPVIELATTQTNTQGAYIYRFDRENAGAELAAFAGPTPAESKVSAKTSSWHWERNAVVVLDRGASSDWRFEDLPEFRSGRFEGVVSIPLVEGSCIIGMANFCRKEGGTWKPPHVSFLLNLSLPLGVLLTASALRMELQKTAQLLADRKLVERAKGLLQSRLGWSEEEAYLRVRRASRRQRRPMRDVAREIIDAEAQQLTEAWGQHGN
jgi:ANTAR domain